MLNAVRPFIDFYRVASFSPIHPPKSVLRRAWQSLAHGWKASKRHHRLELMSDQELARLGIDRAMIGRRAFFGDPPYGKS